MGTWRPTAKLVILAILALSTILLPASRATPVGRSDGWVTYSPAAPCQPEVAPGTYSESQLKAVQSQVEAEFGLNTNQLLGVGLGASTVAVTLSPGQEAAAARIRTQFGSEVSISVGLTNYCGKTGRSPVCSSLPVPTPVPPGLVLSLHLAHATLTSGGLGTATLLVQNNGPKVFQMDTGIPLVAQLVRPGTRRVVATFDSGVGGVGGGPNLAPGQKDAIPVLFGTARCDGGIGSAAPPGHYDVLVFMTPEGPPRNSRPFYYAPPVRLVVSR